MIRKTAAMLTLVAAAATALTVSASEETLPLDAWAMAPAIIDARVSPDGKHLGIVRAQNIAGNYILDIRPIDDLQQEPVFHSAGRDEVQIAGFTWLNDEKILIFTRQNIQDGNDNYWRFNRIIATADNPSEWEILTASGSGGGARGAGTERESNVDLMSALPNDPDEILIRYDDNNNFIPDVGRYNLNTGRITNVMRGTSRINSGFMADWDGEIRAGWGSNSNLTEQRWYGRIKGDSEWHLLRTIHPEDRETFVVQGFSKENPNEVYVLAHRGNDKAGVYLMDIETGEYSSDCLFCPQSVDADGILLSGKPDSLGELTGFSYTGKHPVRYWVDGDEKALYDAVEALFPDKLVNLVSRSDDDSAIIVRTTGHDDPGTFYLLKGKQELQYLASVSTIEPEHLSPVRYVKYTARDGMEIPAYITVPRGDPPFPAIAMPHGGPWVRDVVVYDRWAQFFAHHGYVVIQPQYRGSTGYGLEHWKAGDAKWGLEMQDDVDDAALYLVEQGLADPDRLIIYGFSYGGYSAVIGSMREDNIYQCAIAGAGTGSLDAWRAQTGRSRFLRIFQLPTIQGVNPDDHVVDVNIPILVLHGDIDRIAEVKNSRDFAQALEQHGKDFKYVEIEGMDHGDIYFDHRMEYWTEVLNWLETKCG